MVYVIHALSPIVKLANIMGLIVKNACLIMFLTLVLVYYNVACFVKIVVLHPVKLVPKVMYKVHIILRNALCVAQVIVFLAFLPN